MRFMNDWDIDQAIAWHTRASRPNRLGAALVINNLAEWANAHSDGWAYWPKPARAAARLMELADDTRADEDCTDAELAAAVRPVKSFLTKQLKLTDYRGLPMLTESTRELILRGAETVGAL